MVVICSLHPHGGGGMNGGERCSGGGWEVMLLHWIEAIDVSTRLVVVFDWCVVMLFVISRVLADACDTMNDINWMWMWMWMWGIGCGCATAAVGKALIIRSAFPRGG